MKKKVIITVCLILVVLLLLVSPVIVILLFGSKPEETIVELPNGELVNEYLIHETPLLISEEEVEENENRKIGLIEYEYDSYNRITKETEYSYIESKDMYECFSTKEFILGEDGTFFEHKYNDVNSTICIYDNQDRMYVADDFNEKKARLCAISRYWNGNRYYIRRLENGFLVGRETFNILGDVSSSVSITTLGHFEKYNYEYEYDSDGNILVEKFIWGKEEEHQYRIEEYTYDEGRVVEKKSMRFNRLGDIEKQYVTTYTYAEE
ncbi:MAG: hypothetical protein KBS96_01750 [Lachnospiraceae bacterium]|nr:hypothetical protein [Candidatus Colinaster scatohippi]